MRQCPICALPADELAALEEAAALGTDCRALAERYGLPYWPVRHHVGNHMRAGLRETVAAERLGHREGLAEYLIDDYMETRQFAREMYEKGEYETAQRLRDSVTKSAFVLARALGYVRSDRSITTVTVGSVTAQIAQGQRLAQLLLPAIGDNPDVRARVLAALREASEEDDDGNRSGP